LIGSEQQILSHQPQPTQQQPPLQQKQRSDRIEALPAGSVMPYKRAAAADKSGLPVYQPVQQQQMPQQATYHQILQMQQPNIVPVSYGSAQPLAIPRYQ